VKRLGAIIAGGKATRFGGDKAAALLAGRPLIKHVADGLRDQVDVLIICGREWPRLVSVNDRPSPDLGPLGGLNAALHYAQENGFEAVLTAGCDVLPVAEFPRNQSVQMPFYVEGHYLSGIWPSALADRLDHHLTTQTDFSMRGWIALTDATAIRTEVEHFNLNTQTDLQQYAAQVRVVA
jgi:molybdenum cofactor guanylyltransferase